MGHSTSSGTIFRKFPARPSEILMKICIDIVHGPKLSFLKYFGPTLHIYFVRYRLKHQLHFCKCAKSSNKLSFLNPYLGKVLKVRSSGPKIEKWGRSSTTNSKNYVNFKKNRRFCLKGPLIHLCPEWFI